MFLTLLRNRYCNIALIIVGIKPYTYFEFLQAAVNDWKPKEYSIIRNINKTHRLNSLKPGAVNF